MYIHVWQRVSYNKKTDKFLFTSTNLLNGEMVTEAA